MGLPVSTGNDGLTDLERAALALAWENGQGAIPNLNASLRAAAALGVDVTDELSARREARATTGNHTCPRCGNEWWSVRAVVLNAEDRRITGHTMPLRCVECGYEDHPEGDE